MKQKYDYTTQVIWSQIDVNGHMRHSAYADIAAQARVIILDKMGMDLAWFQQNELGPVLLKEELTYLKEFKLNETVHVNCYLAESNEDASRWTIYQDFFKSNGQKAATVTVFGTWISTKTRKITGLTGNILVAFNQIPKIKSI
jgi:acyl-CoA thioester hydrolase